MTSKAYKQLFLVLRSKSGSKPFPVMIEGERTPGNQHREILLLPLMKWLETPCVLTLFKITVATCHNMEQSFRKKTELAIR